MSNNILYITGLNPTGIPLIGGVWRLRDQEGLPLEMSYLMAREKGFLIDWCEAMADASRSNNCPVLMQSIGEFLPDNVINHLKAGFLSMLKSGKSFDQIVSDKRAGGKAMDWK